MLKHAIIALIFLTLICANQEAFYEFTDNNKEFAAAAYKHASKKNQNFLISPLSAEIVLSLAQNGAKGITRQEIRNALLLPNSTRTINSIFKHLLTGLKNSEGYKLNSANKIYIKDKYPIKDVFANVAKNIYNSPSENIDFGKNEEAAKTINDWVAQQTEDKIRDLIDEDSLNEDTTVVLVNALYLQASWRKHFKKTLTQKRDFYKNETNLIKVDTMKKSDYFGYHESEDLDAKFLQLQFRGGRNGSFVVVLPNKIDGLKKLEGRIKEVYRSSFAWEYVEVTLPKFRIESSVDFKKILKKLGVRKAFSRADFSGMAGTRGELKITDVVQKTYIDVNENGVEAAAATAVLYHPKSLIDFYETKKSFIADHPFLFYVIIDEIVVFTGRVVSPSA